MFSSIREAQLPPHALLSRYAGDQAEVPGYTDCFVTTMPGQHRLEHLIEAFYTGRIFKLERWIIAVLARRPSTDQQAHELATGQRNDFSAWTVEAREDYQILLCPFDKNTRSWLMVEPMPNSNETRLYFGSAVVGKADSSGKTESPWWMRPLLGFHKLYSKVLLDAARKGLS